MTQTFEQVNPADVAIGDNVRLDPKMDKEFIASIRERGVLDPVLLYRADDGTLTVLAGQRRTLAAQQTERPTIPALVEDAPPAEVDRLVDQYVENEHRAALSNSERIGAIEQMALAGLSDHQIAKRTATPKATVKAARTAAQAPALREYADQLTLDQAATLAEFEDDSEAVEALLDAAQQGRFEHLVQRLRDDREEAAKRADFAAYLAEQGVTVIERPTHGDPSIRSLSRLADANGDDLTPDNHAACPGHAAYIGTEWRQPTADDTVVTEDEDDEDDFAYDDEDGEESGSTWQPPVQVLVAQHVCTDYAAHGHVDRWAGTRTGETTKKRAADMTDAERETAKAERRNVIDSNKAWKAATQVRRNWLAGFAQRKTAPAGAEAYLARVMVGGWHFQTPDHETLALAGFTGRDAADVWNVAAEQRQAAADAVATATPKRALQIALAVTLSLWEHSTHPNTWRNHTSHDLDTLAHLKQWGYPTSEIEDRMLATHIEEDAAG